MGASLTITRRNLWLSEAMFKALEESVTDEKKAAPGQLRKQGGWYFLTYLKVHKIQNFNAGTLDHDAREIDAVRAVRFKWAKGGALLVQGGKSGVKEIQEYLNGLTLQVAQVSQESTIEHNNYYKLREVDVDLRELLDAFEARGVLETIKRVGVRGMEVKFGKLKRGVIEIEGLASVKGFFRELGPMADTLLTGFEVSLLVPESTRVAVDVEGVVRVSCGAATADVDLEAMTEKVALSLAPGGYDEAPAEHVDPKTGEIKGGVSDGLLRATRDLCPKDGDQITSVTIEAPGQAPVVLTSKTRKNLDKELDRRKSVREFAKGKAKRARKTA